MLGQSLFGKVFGLIWALILFVLIIRFGGQYIAWWSPFEAKCWASLLVIIGILYFTNQSLVQSLFRAAGGASALGVQGASATANSYHLGRPPMTPAETPRLALSPEDDPLYAAKSFLKSEKNP